MGSEAHQSATRCRSGVALHPQQVWRNANSPPFLALWTAPFMMPVHAHDGRGTTRGPQHTLDHWALPVPQQNEAELGGRPSFDHTTPDAELHRTHVGGLKVGYKGHIPGARFQVGACPAGNVPRRECEPMPLGLQVQLAAPPRYASEVHRKAFKPARQRAQQEASVRQYRLQGLNRWAPFGVDTDDQAITSRSGMSTARSGMSTARCSGTSEQQEYLAVPEEAHFLWEHARQHGGWGGYTNISEKLRNTQRPRSVGPHTRLVRSHSAALQHGAELEPQHPPSPVHHISLLSHPGRRSSGRLQQHRDAEQPSGMISDRGHGRSSRLQQHRDAEQPSGMISDRSSLDSYRWPSPRQCFSRARRGSQFRLGHTSSGTTGRDMPSSARALATGAPSTTTAHHAQQQQHERPTPTLQHAMQPLAWTEEKRSAGAACREQRVTNVATDTARASTRMDSRMRPHQRPVRAEEQAHQSMAQRDANRAQATRDSTAVVAAPAAGAAYMA